MLTRLTVVIILQYIQIWNHVHLKLICYMSILSQFLKTKLMTKIYFAQIIFDSNWGTNYAFIHSTVMYWKPLVCQALVQVLEVSRHVRNSHPGQFQEKNTNISTRDYSRGWQVTQICHLLAFFGHLGFELGLGFPRIGSFKVNFTFYLIWVRISRHLFEKIIIERCIWNVSYKNTFLFWIIH